jgi:hypothetical protein
MMRLTLLVQPYSRQVGSNKAANASAYEAWVKSRTPLQIRQANIARKRLAKLTENNKYPIKLKPIRDDRQVKLPSSSFRLYLSERYESGDLKHMAIGDAAARIAQEWKGLTDREKEVRQIISLNSLRWANRLILLNTEICKTFRRQPPEVH